MIKLGIFPRDQLAEGGSQRSDSRGELTSFEVASLALTHYNETGRNRQDPIGFVDDMLVQK